MATCNYYKRYHTELGTTFLQLTFRQLSDSTSSFRSASIWKLFFRYAPFTAFIYNYYHKKALNMNHTFSLWWNNVHKLTVHAFGQITITVSYLYYLCLSFDTFFLFFVFNIDLRQLLPFNRSININSTNWSPSCIAMWNHNVSSSLDITFEGNMRTPRSMSWH